MNSFRYFVFNALLVLTFAAFASAGIAAPQSSEDTASAPARAVAKQKATTPDGRFTREFQRALESSQPQTAAALLLPAVQKVRAIPSSPARPASSVGDKIAAPGGGLGYTCNGGNCACAGAGDCVTMISGDNKCAEGTVGCNDYGCTCKEN